MSAQLAQGAGPVQPGPMTTVPELGGEVIIMLPQSSSPSGSVSLLSTAIVTEAFAQTSAWFGSAIGRPFTSIVTWTGSASQPVASETRYRKLSVPMKPGFG